MVLAQKTWIGSPNLYIQKPNTPLVDQFQIHKPHLEELLLKMALASQDYSAL
jgi:hypothetical protein